MLSHKPVLFKCFILFKDPGKAGLLLNFKLPSIHHFEVLQETRLRWLSKCTVGLFWGTKHNALAHLDPISRATSKWQNAISRRGIVQLGASLGSIFFSFPVRVARVCAHNSRRKSSAPGS